MFLALRRLARSGAAVMIDLVGLQQHALRPRRPGVRQVDGHVGHVLAHDVDDLVAGVGRDVVVAIEHDRRGEDRQMLGALGQQAVEQHLVETLGARQRVGDALHRILVEIEAGGAEGEIEIGDDDVGLEDLRQRPGRVVADGRRADAALGADEGDRRGRRDRCRDCCRDWRWPPSAAAASIGATRYSLTPRFSSSR